LLKKLSHFLVRDAIRSLIMAAFLTAFLAIEVVYRAQTDLAFVPARVVVYLVETFVLVSAARFLWFLGIAKSAGLQNNPSEAYAAFISKTKTKW
jgi:hypothetical protein